MYKTKLGIASFVIVLFFKLTVHAATLTSPPASSAAPSEALEPSNLKMSTSPAWVSRCVSESRKSLLVCSAEESLVFANTGQVVASIVVRTQSDTQDPVMMIRVPVGLYLPAGLKIQVDGGKPQPVPLETCDLQGCYAEMQISSDLLAALKGGKRLSILCQNSAKKDLVLPLVLDNFADAFRKIQ
jgi:invasion protein IalB